MAKNAPVRKTSYKRLTQEALVLYASNIVNRMSADAAYTAYADDLAVFGPLVSQFKTAVENAKDRSIPNVIVKNQLRKKVEAMLDNLTDRLILDYKGDDTWIANAGMEVTAPPARSMGQLEPPANLRLINKGTRGELTVIFDVPDPKRVVLNAVEYSSDKGVTWHNGTYGKNKSIQVSNLPGRQDLMIRVRSLGTLSRKSAWSEAVVAFVS
jgi:hypothetical protein